MTVAEAGTRKELAQHKVTIDLPPDLPRIWIDFELDASCPDQSFVQRRRAYPACTQVRLIVKAEDGAVLFIVVIADWVSHPNLSLTCSRSFYRAPVGPGPAARGLDCPW